MALRRAGQSIALVKLAVALGVGVMLFNFAAPIQNDLHEQATDDLDSSLNMPMGEATTGLSWMNTMFNHALVVFAFIGVFGFLVYTVYITEGAV